MIAYLFVVTGKDYVALCQKLGKTQEAERMQKAIDAMIEAVKKHGWDGEWYLRAYDFYGNKIGSNECDEAKIFIESQGWCTIMRLALRKVWLPRVSTLVRNTSSASTVWCLTTPPSPSISTSTAKSHHTPRATRRMLVSSATTILGSSSASAWQAR